MIEVELELSASQSMDAVNFSRSKIDILHVGFDYIDVTQNPPQRINNVGRRKITGGDFVQHRREENKILPRDQRHFDVLPPRQTLVEILGRIQAGKSAASDNYFGFLSRF
jgi:hypothetical protein